MKKALVCGAGGFVGGHLAKRLKNDGLWVRGIDLKFPEYSETAADDFIIGDLRNQDTCRSALDTRSAGRRAAACATGWRRPTPGSSARYGETPAELMRRRRAGHSPPGGGPNALIGGSSPS